MILQPNSKQILSILVNMLPEINTSSISNLIKIFLLSDNIKYRKRYYRKMDLDFRWPLLRQKNQFLLDQGKKNIILNYCEVLMKPIKRKTWLVLYFRNIKEFLNQNLICRFQELGHMKLIVRFKDQGKKINKITYEFLKSPVHLAIM